MATAASTIITRIEGLLGFDSDTIGLPGLEATQLLSLINIAHSEYFETFRKGGGEPPMYMRTEAGGTLASNTALNGAITTSDTSIAVDDGTNAGSSGGAIVVWDNDTPDIIFYTGKSSNTLTGVTDIDFAHEDDDAVQLLATLPSDFGDLRQGEGYGDGVNLNGTDYTYTSGTPDGTQFAVIDDGSTQYLWFPDGASGDYHVYYNKRPTTIDGTTDNIDIPDYMPKDQWFPVYRVAQRIAPLLDKDPSLYQIEADRILGQALKSRYIGKRPRLLRSARELNTNARGRAGTEFYNPQTGVTGWFE